MENQKKKENLLSTWKEIAAYLDCTDRTCRRWEAKCGLPVHRVDKSPKAMVFALKNELDDWLIQQRNSLKSDLRIVIKKRILLSLLIAVPLLTIAILLITSRLASMTPADFDIKGSTFTFMNEKGKPLWEYDTEIENLSATQIYRHHFQQVKIVADSKIYPHLIIKDLNHDGRKEVLLSIQTVNELNEGKLICFNWKGRVLWTIQTGRVLEYGGKTYSPDYRISYMNVADIDHDGDMEVLLVSAQRYFFPTQFLVLDHNGKIIGEYWNTGRISDFSVVDIDEDGINEIILGGCNNAYNKACIIVFDHKNIDGFSPQTADYSSSSFQTGTENFYILFPNTDVCLTEAPRGSINRMDILSNQKLLIREAHTLLYFVVDFHMKVEKILLSDTFRRKHKKAKEAGLISSDFDDASLEALVRQVLYWNGSEWVSTPTKVQR